MTDSKQSPLVEGEDFVFDSSGNMVFTKAFLERRGYCCQSGCTNCPYGHTANVDPNIPTEFSSGWSEED